MKSYNSRTEGKYTSAIVFFLIGASTVLYSNNLKSDTLKLEGKYSGKNIYVANPPTGEWKCSFHRVLINGKESTGAQTYGSAFEVDLKSFHLALAQRVKIEILYEGTPPKVLNPESLK